MKSSNHDTSQLHDLLPPLTPEEYEWLKASIADHGVEKPVVVDQDENIVDGFERQRACDELGIFCPREVRHFETEEQKYELRVRLNCRRRQLNQKQKSAVIETYLRCDPQIADNYLSDLIGVSQNTVAKVREKLVATFQIEKFDKLRGRDGKERPTKYKRIIANTAKEAEAALGIVSHLPANCDGQIIDAESASRAGLHDPTRNQAMADADACGEQDKTHPPRDNGGASTPQWLFDRCNELAIDACGEPITLDVAAAEWNHKCERYFTEEDDGRAQDWNAKAVWLNPPYSSTIIEAFVRKAIESARHGTTTFGLLPWWNYPYLDLCEQHGRIHRIGSPVTFHREDGSTLTLNNQYRTTPLVVVVFGPTIKPGFGEVIRKDAAVTGKNRGGQIDCPQPSGILGRAIAGSGDRRRKGDDYYTPSWAIDSLLDVEAFTGLTWEPAEGDGRIVRAFQKAGGNIIGSDLSTGTDFLVASQKVENVVTNPPWSLKSEFIQHAKEVARSKVAMLFPLSALSVKGLRPLFEDGQFPLRTVYVFDRRVNFHPDGEGSSTITAGWFVWERGYKGEPVLKWCNRHGSCDKVSQPTITHLPVHIDWSSEEYIEHESY